MSKSCEIIIPVQPLLDPKIHCEEYKLLHCVPLVLVKQIQRATPLMYRQRRVQNMFCYLLVWNQFEILIINTVDTLLMNVPIHGQPYLKPLHKTPTYSTAIQCTNSVFLHSCMRPELQLQTLFSHPEGVRLQELPLYF